MDSSFTAAMEALERSPDGPDGLAAPFVSVFPVTGASVSTLGDLLGSETLAATDEFSAHMDEVQFDLGEGPCWDAMRSARPVLMPDVRTGAPASWPSFAAAIDSERLGSLFAFPLRLGPLRIGAIDLYSVKPVRFDRDQARQAGAMAEVVSRQVLRHALEGVEAAERPSPLSRRVIHQATGFVLAQLDVSPEDARLVIQGHAFATSRSMMEVATDIVEGRLRFTKGIGGIEAVS
ncbi:GAF and ANTAR domain-containing protein [Agromyces salentinus]|uniref:GAF domain-containing protein n=1 Tax=Agromyces salentinus TaxID=269421 RepID=A0ABN2MTA7_9MICO|nr:GAF and ANTAR domain-containing protein [Agromyces salentinus]